MSSLSSIMNIATSGLYTAQSGLNVVSKNVANANTEGYVRLEQQQSNLNYGGINGGVTVDAIRRATNTFLEATALNANSAEAGASVKSQYLDSLQSIFGDPSEDTSIFSTLNNALASFETAASNPTSTIIKSQIIANLQSALSQLGQASQQIKNTQNQVDKDISSKVDTVNNLLKNIVEANSKVVSASITGDATGAQETLSGFINQLSDLVDINVDYGNDGSAKIYTTNSMFLAGTTASTLSYSSLDGNSDPSINIKITPNSTPMNIESSVQSGSLRGLLDLRNVDLPKISEAVNQFAGKYADAVNSVYNLNSTLPALSSTTGSDTGLLATDSLGFTGNTSIGIVDSSGTLVSKIAIDFDNLTMSVNGGAATSFANTVGGFTSALNTALGANGTASFANGKLSLTASTSGNGLVFDEPSAGGSLRGDKAFAHFFGLNNLISSTTPTSPASGIKGTDANGFTAGDTFTLALSDGNGKPLSTKTISIPSGTFDDIISAMNDNSTGFGIYGTFSLNSDGSLKFTQSNGGTDYSFNMIDDSENRGTTSVSLGEMLGFSDEARNSIAQSLSVNSKIATNPSALALATTDLTSTNVGSIALGKSDSSGAQALFNASAVKLNFSTSPLSGSKSTMTLSDYMSSVAGDIGTRASNAETAATAAASFKTDAKTRLANTVGVNLDEELVKMTQFQQAYSASARMLKAAVEMFHTFLDAAG